VGDEYPSAQILGTDLSPIQPVWVPPNVKFMVDDAELDWLELENFYDFVHGRHITPAIKNFPALIERAFKYSRNSPLHCGIGKLTSVAVGILSPVDGSSSKKCNIGRSATTIQSRPLTPS
jgi:hypothetical protein